MAAAPILTRLYDPDDFGLLAVYSGILALVLVVASVRYELAIPLPEDEEEAANIAVLSLLIVLGGDGAQCVGSGALRCEGRRRIGRTSAGRIYLAAPVRRPPRGRVHRLQLLGNTNAAVPHDRQDTAAPSAGDHRHSDVRLQAGERRSHRRAGVGALCRHAQSRTARLAKPGFSRSYMEWGEAGRCKIPASPYLLDLVGLVQYGRCAASPHCCSQHCSVPLRLASSCW